MKSVTCRRRWVVLAALVSVGCDVTPDKIATWKASVNGGEKLRAAVRDGDLDRGIRVMAAEALTELGQFEPLADDLKSLAPAPRKQILDALMAKLLTRMRGASEQATTRVQRSAKDALHSLRMLADPTKRAEVDAAVVGWILADWPRRSMGEHSGEKILTTIGGAAANAVSERVDADPRSALLFARVLAQIGKPGDLERAARKLVALADRQKGAEAATLEAIGRLKHPLGRQYLLRLAKSGPAEVRAPAMLALRHCPDGSLVGTLAAIAGNSKEDGDLRERAFEALEAIEASPTLDALAGFLAGSDKVLRYRAVEAMVACCKAKGVAKLLQTLPSRYTYRQEDVQDYIVKDIRDLGASALAPVREALSSSAWVARVVAVRVLGDLGTKEDLSRLEKLVDDKKPIPGWGRGATVGAEAQTAIAKLKKRL